MGFIIGIVAAVAGLAAYGSIESFRTIKKNGPSVWNILTGVASTMALGGFLSLLLNIALADPGTISPLAFVMGYSIAAVIALLSYLVPKKDNDGGTSFSNEPWYNASPGVFFIGLGFTSLAGISLVLNSSGYSAHHITQNQIGGVVQAATSATGAKLAPALGGEVFIQKGTGLHGDDTAVFVAPDVFKGYTVHVVSLKPNGTMSSPLDPKDSNKPFFIPGPGGYQINPDISLPSINSLVTAGNSSLLSPTSQAAVLNLASAQSHDVTPN